MVPRDQLWKDSRHLLSVKNSFSTFIGIPIKTLRFPFNIFQYFTNWYYTRLYIQYKWSMYVDACVQPYVWIFLLHFFPLHLRYELDNMNKQKQLSGHSPFYEDPFRDFFCVVVVSAAIRNVRHKKEGNKNKKETKSKIENSKLRIHFGSS